MKIDLKKCPTCKCEIVGKVKRDPWMCPKCKTEVMMDDLVIYGGLIMHKDYKERLKELGNFSEPRRSY